MARRNTAPESECQRMRTGHSRFILPGILAGMVLGGVVGWNWPAVGQGSAFLGRIFIQMLFAMVVPLIVTSMVVGIASLGDIRKVGRTGVVTLVYFLLTTGIAVLLGLILVNLIQPGMGATPSGEIAERFAGRAAQTSFWGAIIAMVESLFPRNLFAAMSEGQVLPLILFSLVLGGVLTTIGAKGKVVLEVFEGLNEAVLRIVMLILYVAPIGVFGLVAGKIGTEIVSNGQAHLLGEFEKLLRYMMTVVVGLVIHGGIILPLILVVLARRPILRFVTGFGQALLTAFSTASSSATLPVTLECAVDRAGISRASSYFVIPLGATVNMNGTALYEAVAVMFIAQAFGLEMTVTQQVIIFLTATLAAIGAAGIPEAGLVTMLIVFRAVNFPDPIIEQGLTFILAVDWFLDRCRTTINVWGDCVGAAVVDRLTFVRSAESEPPATPAAAPG